MAGRLEGKVALITGAGRGMGAEEARLFAREGAKVLLADVLGDAIDDLAASLESEGYDVVAQRLDVTRQQDWEAAVAGVEQRWGRLDVLVNNAGVLGIEGVEACTPGEWERIVAVNQTGTWMGMKAVVPVLRASGGGSIVNISSIYGLVGSGVAAAYHATKGAVRALTKTAAVELGPAGIRVNSVHPGFIRTPMLEGSLPEAHHGVFMKELSAQSPLARLGTPEDVAQGVLYLASDESAFVTGAELVIDGGVTAR